MADPGEWIPADTFGNRLAILRSQLGWNVLHAATVCGVNAESWRQWERTGRKPRDVLEISQRIASATGVSYEWLVLGGPLSAGGGAPVPVRSRCDSLGARRPNPGEVELPFPADVELPEYALAILAREETTIDVTHDSPRVLVAVG